MPVSGPNCQNKHNQLRQSVLQAHWAKQLQTRSRALPLTRRRRQSSFLGVRCCWTGCWMPHPFRHAPRGNALRRSAPWHPCCLQVGCEPRDFFFDEKVLSSPGALPPRVGCAGQSVHLVCGHQTRSTLKNRSRATSVFSATRPCPVQPPKCGATHLVKVGPIGSTFCCCERCSAHSRAPAGPISCTNTPVSILFSYQSS